MSAPSPSQTPSGPGDRSAAPPAAQTAVEPQVFRLQRSAYLVVLFLTFCAAPLAFASTGTRESPAEFGPRALLMLVPVIAAVYIARTATIVDERGVQVRALLGSRLFPWESVRGLTVNERSVYVALVDGVVRLPCVRIADLAAVTRASGGRLPRMAEARPKYAPSKRSRRR